MKYLLILLFSTFSYCQQIEKDSITIYYDTGAYEITPLQKQKIDSFLNIKNLINIKSIKIISYTDAVGSNISNDTLAKQRALTISNFIKKEYHYINQHVNALGKHPNSNIKLPENPNHRFTKIIRSYDFFKDKIYDCHLEPLAELQIGHSVSLYNIHFDWGRYNIKKESLHEIHNLYYFLKENPNLVIEIQGHVCCGRPKEAKGLMKSAHNKKLSTNRALEVRKKLINMGISTTRITAEGYGYTRPVVFPEKTTDDAYKNRRIEIKTIQK